MRLRWKNLNLVPKGYALSLDLLKEILCESFLGVYEFLG